MSTTLAADPADEADGPAPASPVDATGWRAQVALRVPPEARARTVAEGEALVRAAGVLLERSEGDGFTVQDVADETGQSLRTLYRCFEGKDDLLLALFEEAMRTYADLIVRAIDDLDDPLERLAGALLAVLRLPDLATAGAHRGLTRLRLHLAQAQPGPSGRSLGPVADLLRGLAEAATVTGGITPRDPDEATFLLLSMSATSLAPSGPDHRGIPEPHPIDVVWFCLRGLGGTPDRAWLASLDPRVHLPDGPVGLDGLRPTTPSGGAP